MTFEGTDPAPDFTLAAWLHDARETVRAWVAEGRCAVRARSKRALEMLSKMSRRRVPAPPERTVRPSRIEQLGRDPIAVYVAAHAPPRVAIS